MTLVIDPKVALLKGVDPVQFCVFSLISKTEKELFLSYPACEVEGQNNSFYLEAFSVTIHCIERKRDSAI